MKLPAILLAFVSTVLVASPAAADCLDEFAQRMTVPRTDYPNGLSLRPTPNTVVDLTGVTVRAMGSPSDQLSTLKVDGWRDGLCIHGGRFVSKQSAYEVPWVDGSLQDGINVSGDNPASTTFEMRSSWIKDTSDDGIQNDGGKKMLGIFDSLIEAKMGISMRPGSSSPQPPGSHGNYLIPIHDTLFNILCVADDRPDGSDSRNPAKAQNNFCGPQLASADVFKWSDASKDVGVDMRDVVIHVVAPSRNGWSSHDWPKGTYSNVTLVWDSVRPGSPYRGPALPPGVRMVTDRAVWMDARAVAPSRSTGGGSRT